MGKQYYPFSEEDYTLAIEDTKDGVLRDDVCRIIGAGTSIVNNKLYFSGGVWTLNTVNADGTGGFKNDLNNRVLTFPLDKSFSWNDLSLTSTPKPDDIPSLYLEAVVHPNQNSTKFYTLNGVYQDPQVQAPFKYPGVTDNKYRYPPNKYAQIYSYDTATGKWEQEDMKGDKIIRVASGQYTDDTVRGVSYYLDGSTGADQDADIKDGSWVYYPALIEYDFNTNTIRNLTHTMRPRQRGMLNYIPAGEKGMLVAFGGRHVQAGIKNPTGNLNNMDEIWVYDIALEKWYQQKAAGVAIPPGRQAGCSVVQSAPDGSSHNIYMFSGGTAYWDSGLKYNDLWVLSIPSFTWIKMFNYTGPEGSLYHRCHAVGNHLLITSGFRDPVPVSSGSNCSRLISSIDLTTGNWQPSTPLYPGFSTQFSVPSYITSLIGGTSSGGATITKPQAGFTWTELERAFAKPFITVTPAGSSSSSQSSSASDSSSLQPGAIAGIAIGAVGGFILACLAFWFFLRKRRRSRAMALEMDRLAEGASTFMPVASSSTVNVKGAPPDTVLTSEMESPYVDGSQREKFGGHYAAPYSEVDGRGIVRELDGSTVYSSSGREVYGDVEDYHAGYAQGYRELDSQRGRYEMEGRGMMRELEGDYNWRPAGYVPGGEGR